MTTRPMSWLAAADAKHQNLPRAVAGTSDQPQAIGASTGTTDQDRKVAKADAGVAGQ